MRNTHTHKIGFVFFSIHPKKKQVVDYFFFACFNLFELQSTFDTSIRSLSFRFEEQHSCRSWFDNLKRALSNRREAPHRPPPPPPSRSSVRKSLYPQMQPESRGSVPPAVERCISHITAHGGFHFLWGLSFRLSACLPTCLTDLFSLDSQASTWRACTAAAASLPRSRAWLRLW